MKLLLDEMFSIVLAEQLRARGHDVVSVHDPNHVVLPLTPRRLREHAGRAGTIRGLMVIVLDARRARILLAVSLTGVAGA